MIIYFESKNKYNPDDVLTRIGDERIFDYFLGTKIDDHNSFKCCFHEDKTPSLRFKRMPSGQLIYNCFGCGAKGNVYRFVQDLYKIPFQEAVKLIVDTLEGEKSGVIKYKPSIKVVEESKTQIYPYFKKYSKSDLDYWTAFNISQPTLIKYNVEVCSKVFIFGKSTPVELIYSPSNPIFCYILGKDTYKIYRPLNPSKKGKFFSNANEFSIQGLSQLPKFGDNLIITSSLKDIMVLDEIGYNAVAPQGEGINIPDKILDYLMATFKNIYVLYDSDEAGYKYSNKLCEKYGFKNIFIPEKYQTKDISDFSKKYGINETRLLINNLVNG